MRPRRSHPRLGMLVFVGASSIVASVLCAPAGNASPSRPVRAVEAPAGPTDGPAEQSELVATDGASIGASVSVDGSTAIVTGSGAAYVFAHSKTGWTEQATLVPSDGVPVDGPAAVSGPVAVLGAPGDGSGPGAAYVFARAGGIWAQVAELAASDGVPGDSFGASVSISGSIAVVGAPAAGSGAGAAYVFEPAGGVWGQTAELTASDGVPGDSFGASVSVSGSVAIVGAPGAVSDTGAAYTFVRSKTGWNQEAALTSSDGSPGDAFGASVSVSETSAIVGAPGAASNTGAAFTFARAKKAWSQESALSGSDGAPGDGFGTSVSISGSTAVAGSPGAASGTGAAYTFDRSGTTWFEGSKQTASDGAAGDALGTAVAVSGSTAIAGAPVKGVAYAFELPVQRARLVASDGASNDLFGASVSASGATAIAGAPGASAGAGAAYVFARTKEVWSQSAELTAPGGVPGDSFGASVAVSGSIAIVGAPGVGANTGAAYVFVHAKGAWTEKKKLLAYDGVPGDSFGVSIAFDGSTAIVGAPGRTTGTGAAYLFILSNGSWSGLPELVANHGSQGDRFGSSVAVSDSTAVVGASGRTSGAGAAYVFGRTWTTWTLDAVLGASDQASNDRFGSSVAISGSTAVVGASGRNSGAGAVYVFVDAKKWVQRAEITASDGAPADAFAASVALAGTTMLASAPGKDANTGALYAFTGSGPTWSQTWELAASHGEAGDLFGASVALSRSLAVAGAPGAVGATGAVWLYNLPKG